MVSVRRNARYWFKDVAGGGLVLGLIWLTSHIENKVANKRDRPKHNSNTSNVSHKPSSARNSHPVVTEATPHNAVASDKKHKAREWHFWRRQLRSAQCLNWITAIGAGAATLSFIGVAVTFLITKESVDVSVMALHQSQRPWVSADATKIDSIAAPEFFDRYNVQVPHDHFEIAVKIALKNSGQSTAIRGFIDAHMTSNSLESTWKSECASVSNSNAGSIQKPFLAGFVLPPGGEFYSTKTMQNDDVSYKTFSGGSFWLMGCIAYSDQFNFSHHTKFCFLSNGEGGMATTFRNCETAEEAD